MSKSLEKRLKLVLSQIAKKESDNKDKLINLIKAKVLAHNANCQNTRNHITLGEIEEIFPESKVSAEQYKYYNPKQPITEYWAGNGLCPMWIRRELFNNVPEFRNKDYDTIGKTVSRTYANHGISKDLHLIAWKYINDNFLRKDRIAA